MYILIFFFVELICGLNILNQNLQPINLLVFDQQIQFWIEVV